MKKLEKEERPIWLDEMNKLVTNTKQKVADLQEKLNEIHYGKGPRPELTPPGAPPSFAKSFWGKEMAEFYKEEIEEAKKFTYDHCSKMLEHIDVNERTQFADEIKRKLEVTRPDSMQPKHKEEEKGLDASQNYINGLTDKFLSNDNVNPAISAHRENVSDIFHSKDIDKE